MINVEELYTNKEFNHFLQYTAHKNIPLYTGFEDFEDFKQDVFVEISESGCSSFHDCKVAAWRVRDRMIKRFYDEPPSVLWEDNHIL